MPEWFLALLLIVFLAGFVFLFLQVRLVSRRQELHALELGRIARQIEELAPRPPPIAAAPPAAQPVPPPAVPGALLRRLDAVADALAAQEQALAQLRETVETLLLHARYRSEPAPSPEQIARQWLLSEGYSRITVTGSEELDEGIRYFVRALRSDEVHTGPLIVQQGKVTGASLKVPTSLFP